MLSKIQAVLTDAEEKQMTDRAVNLWLDDLQDLAYDLDDVVDEFATEALRQKLMAECQASTSKIFHLSSLEAVDFLDTFLSMNPDSSGQVKIHDFFRVLRLKACNHSEKIFGLLDVEKKVKITFKQFLYGSAHVLKQPLFRRACELAFIECHTGGNHYISEQELGDSITQAIPNMDDYEIHELFKLFDTNSHGRISKDDFIACLRRNPLLIALFFPQLMYKNLSGAMIEEG